MFQVLIWNSESIDLKNLFYTNIWFSLSSILILRLKKYLRFYQSCRLIVMFFVSGFTGFCAYYTAVKVDKINIDFKTSHDIVFFIRTIKNCSEDFFYYLGFYLFHKGPHYVQEEQVAMKNFAQRKRNKENCIRNWNVMTRTCWSSWSLQL